MTITEGLRRARARLRQPTYRPWSPSGRLWGSGVPGTRLVLGPRKPLDCRQLQQPGRRDTTRFFGTRSKASMDWATTHAGPQAIALCQHPELHMARHDDFMTIVTAFGQGSRALSLNREGLVELCHQNKCDRSFCLFLCLCAPERDINPRACNHRLVDEPWWGRSGTGQPAAVRRDRPQRRQCRCWRAYRRPVHGQRRRAKQRLLWRL